MSVKVFFGKQTAEGASFFDVDEIDTLDEGTTLAVDMLDLGATDFTGGEKYIAVKSEVFNTLQAEGDQFLTGIETTFETPVEWNAKVLEALLSSLSYSKTAPDLFYKMTSAEPAWFTVVVSDSLNSIKTTYVDCKVNSLTLNASKGALVNGNISWIGKVSTFESGTIVESVATSRGESLVAIDSTVEMGGTAVTTEVESVVIEINNGLEAKGSINSLYTQKIKRSTPQSTSATLEFNSYNHARFAAIKQKAVTNATENLKLILKDGIKTITVEIPKMYVTTSDRGDYKGAGTHSLAMSASVNNAAKTPIKFTF